MLSSYTIRGLCHVCHSPRNTVYHLRQLHFHNRQTQQQQQKQQLVSELALIQSETSAIRREHTCLRVLQSTRGKEVAGWAKICAKKEKPGSCVAERQTGHLRGQLQLGVGVCVCLLGWWPAATRLHVHCPTAGVEVRWVGLSGKWPQRGAMRLVEHSSSEWVLDHQLHQSPMFPNLLSGRDSKAVVFLTEAYNVIHIRMNFISQTWFFMLNHQQQQLKISWYEYIR